MIQCVHVWLLHEFRIYCSKNDVSVPIVKTTLENGDYLHSKISNVPDYFGCRGPCPYKFEINNDHMMEMTQEKLPMSPCFSVGWALCPQCYINLAKHCVLLVRFEALKGYEEWSVHLLTMLFHSVSYSSIKYNNVLTKFILIVLKVHQQFNDN